MINVLEYLTYHSFKQVEEEICTQLSVRILLTNQIDPDRFHISGAKFDIFHQKS